MGDLEKIIISKKSNLKPVWFMRQAGRYLPEFRKIRSENKDFIKLCLNSNLSSEITLQPLKRFNLDAAIIFSDILMIPYALGQSVEFKKNLGPTIEKFDYERFNSIDEKKFIEILDPVYKAIEITRKNLPQEKSLISFVGAPWTLLVYMLNLKDNIKKLNLDSFKKNIKNIDKIMFKLNKFICLHIEKQISAGANLIQIFDSWAGLIPKDYFNNLCIEPNLNLVKFCKEKKIITICFPKGINKNLLKFNGEVQPDCISLDYDVDPFWARENLTGVALQGGMHPKFLLMSEKDMLGEAKKYLDVFRDVPYIFNLGHGLVPETNPDKLKKLVEFVKEYK
tara:strand:- start:1376 stop:2386 length:1011 start_codon:yes stop_codon:yes gene_type:complete